MSRGCSFEDIVVRLLEEAKVELFRYSASLFPPHRKKRYPHVGMGRIWMREMVSQRLLESYLEVKLLRWDSSATFEAI